MKNKIKIDFDARMIGHSGIGTQVDNLLSDWISHPRLDLALIGDPFGLKRRFPDFKGPIIEFDAPIYSLKEQFLFPPLREGSFLHSPHYNAPIKRLSRTVVVVHDLIHLQSTEFARPHYRLYAKLLLDQISKRSAKIVTVSETTRRELAMRFPEAEKRSVTVLNGMDHSLFAVPRKKELKEFKSKYGLPDHFLLVVGIGKRHKNVDFVVRALSELWRNGKLSAPLVIGGTGGQIPDYVQMEIENNQVHDHIHVLPYLERMELPLMYASADVLIMSSLLEGFGFPVIEAMACGTPVLSSNASSLPEVAGSAAHFFDPKDPVDFSNGVLKVLKDARYRNRLIEKGTTNASKYSWKKYSREMLKVYESLA